MQKTYRIGGRATAMYRVVWEIVVVVLATLALSYVSHTPWYASLPIMVVAIVVAPRIAKSFQGK